MSALIDSGCKVNLIICKDVYKQIGLPTLKATKISLRDFGNSEVFFLSCFEAIVEIDNEELKLAQVNLYVPSNAMLMVMIIGNNILKQADIKERRSNSFENLMGCFSGPN